MSTQFQSLLQSSSYQKARQQFLGELLQASKLLSGVRAGSTDPAIREAYLEQIRQFSQERGRDLFFSFLSSGIGHGPWVELKDGSVKYDMITGIGINFLGTLIPV